MAHDEDILFLRRIPTFRVLGPDALRVLAISTEKMHLRLGDTLFGEGESSDGAFVVIAGAIRLRRAKDKPLEEPQVARSGALIGESALIIETERSASAIALEPSTLYRITRAVFLRMLESDVEAADALREMISRRIDAALDDLDLVLPRFEPQ